MTEQKKKKRKGPPLKSTEGLTPMQIKKRVLMRNYMRDNWKKYKTPKVKERDAQYHAEYRRRPEVKEMMQAKEKLRVGTRNEYFKEYNKKRKKAQAEEKIDTEK